MFYHGTDIGGLEELRAKKSNEGEWVYLSDDRLRILPYCVNPIQLYADRKYGKGKVNVGTRMADFGFIDGKLTLNSIYPHFFEDVFKGQVGYIYTFENLDNVQFLGKPHVFGYPGKLKVENVEVIPDMYEELLRLEKEGSVILRRYEDMDEAYQQRTNERYLEYYKNAPKYSKEYWYDKMPYLRDKFDEIKKD